MNLQKDLYETNLAIVKVGEKLLQYETDEEKRKELVATVTLAKLSIMEAITERVFYYEQTDTVRKILALGIAVQDETEKFLQNQKKSKTITTKDNFVEFVGVYYKLMTGYARSLPLF